MYFEIKNIKIITGIKIVRIDYEIKIRIIISFILDWFLIKQIKDRYQLWLFQNILKTL